MNLGADGLQNHIGKVLSKSFETIRGDSVDYSTIYCKKASCANFKDGSDFTMLFRLKTTDPKDLAGFLRRLADSIAGEDSETK